jgi:Tol biopolymer transport system component
VPSDNLVAGAHAGPNIYVHDLQTGETTLVSVNSQGDPANQSSQQTAISGDGRFVAFWSGGTNLVPGDTNGLVDIFVHDRQTGETTRVSVDSQGGQANDQSFDPAISADGRFVAFQSSATNLVPGDTNVRDDVFVHDRQTGKTIRGSVDSSGAQADNKSILPALSGDGRLVAFASLASNLVADDTNGKWDVFVHDLETGETRRMSVDSQGKQGDLDSSRDEAPSISSDGRLVAFMSRATNLVANDTNGKSDVFLHDLETGVTTRVSVDTAGTQADDDSDNAAISPAGGAVAFASRATNLVAGDTNGFTDQFVHDREGACAVPASWTNYGSGWAGTNGVPALVATSDPALCAPLGVFVDNSAGVTTLALLLAGDRQASRWTPWDGCRCPPAVFRSRRAFLAKAISVDGPCSCRCSSWTPARRAVCRSHPGSS